MKPSENNLAQKRREERERIALQEENDRLTREKKAQQAAELASTQSPVRKSIDKDNLASERDKIRKEMAQQEEEERRSHEQEELRKKEVKENVPANKPAGTPDRGQSNVIQIGGDDMAVEDDGDFE